MKKQSYNPKRNPNRSSTLSEKFLSRLGNYLIVTITIMLLGFIYHDGPWRGFPLPWIFNMRHVLFSYFVSSLLIIAAAVIGSDILAQIIIAVKEPKLKVHTKEPFTASSYSANTEPFVGEYPDDELYEYEPETSSDTYSYDKSEGEVDSAELSIDLQSLREANEKLANYSRKILNQKATNNQGNEGKSSIFPILAIIAIIVSMAAALIDNSGDDFDFLEEDWNEDEIVLDEDNLFSTAEDAATDRIEHLFYAMTGMDYDFFEENEELNNSDDNAAELLELTNWDEMSYEEIYSYLGEDDNYALRKYILTDSNEKEYIMAVYMDISNQTEGYEAYLSGIALISKEDYDLGMSKLADKNKISDEEYEQYFMDKIISIGSVALDEEHIIFWYDSSSLYEMAA